MEITASLVKRLREETDAPMMDCKRALTQAAEKLGAEATEDTVLAEAKQILRESGKVQAGKRADRATSAGTVAVAKSGNAAAAVSLLSETDFVARNEDFKALAQKLADHFVQNDPGDDPLSAVIDGKTVKELIEDAVAKIRENIQLGAVKRISSEGAVGVYVHHDSTKAALVALANSGNGYEDLASKIGIQVVALSPEFISKDGVDQDRLEKEIAIERQRAIEDGKPEEIAEKIAQGKVNKEFLQQVVLTEQAWYADQSKRTAEVMGGAKVTRFIRIEAGKPPTDTTV
ncbi:MAG: Elongation factor Ts [Fimbriimonadales bacterium]|nr:MAG: translation elongation factor Ts [Armatimonadota bacterium]MBV6503578.1 Elongation factor Ts [Fimbriimonadales bacterium]MCE7900704.1 translation elongation factor Ts [Armatimonadetes bacterium ATM1]MDL1928584.1 translation elongation factor Ts [Fimbriimonadia bacterium ATM]MBC6970066.1 translation elongation factor Ts [Armatimonadota bacterium]